MASHLTHVVRALGLGLVSGGRAAAGPTAVLFAWNVYRRNRFTAVAVPLAVIAALGEAVGDKLPKTPSRLDQPGLSVRLVSGALAAGALTLTGRRPAATALAAVIGAGGAYLGSRGGSLWRGAAAKQFGQDLPGALIEDAATWASAFALGRGAVRSR